MEYIRKELLDARKALRSVRAGGNGPKKKKLRGECDNMPRSQLTVDNTTRHLLLEEIS